MASSSMQPDATENKSILTPVMTLEGHEPWKNLRPDGEYHEFKYISCISYSPDGKQMISGSYDKTIRRWDLREGKEIEEAREVCDNCIYAVRVSRDGRWVVTACWKELEVSEVETGIVRTFYIGSIYCIDISADSALVAGGSEPRRRLSDVSSVPVFWTTKDKSIIAASNCMDDDTTIHEFDASTLKTVGAPFKHTEGICGLALSSDCVLLASSSRHLIKLWALRVPPTPRFIRPYTIFDDNKIFICDIPANILASIRLEAQPSTNKSDSRHAGLLNSNATRPPARRKPVMIPAMSPIPRPLPTRDPHARLRFLRKLFSRTDAGRIDEPNPLDFPATSPLPRPLPTHDENSRRTPAPPTTQSSVINTSPTLKSNRLSNWWRALPTIVDVPLAPGRLRYAAAGAPGPDDELIRDEDYVSPPSPNPGSRPGIFNSGQHGSGRFCFCF
ncbi:quinon protein alcohol dehydrogenase-like superfamily [Suillus discolor]|uniref:Quinon protein alcohol dehydrogenase-like superfamily n=1 Tax=Suillus discolor TaxID=1912936 RepID=A0A9P7JQD3_9AGAM|nr:quinon protein alcohol dehydrogenase-like superfamily [Suillus discolor]KAG2099830.1 quinon protein alcohol dehydrogenase-like superfamily [Suillus discolor]